jgi:hypothetical protein
MCSSVGQTPGQATPRLESSTRTTVSSAEEKEKKIYGVGLT